jgi:hypothetical protein
MLLECQIIKNYTLRIHDEQSEEYQEKAYEAARQR